jgi:hypothetical protein
MMYPLRVQGKDIPVRAFLRPEHFVVCVGVSPIHQDGAGIRERQKLLLK